MSSNDDGSDRPPPPRNPPGNFQDLLRLCMSTVPQDPDEDDGNNRLQSPQAMEPDDREWLSSALSSMTTSVVQEMAANIKTVQDGLAESGASADGRLLSMETVDKIQSAIDSLIDRTGNLDNAGDFCKIGGFDIFEPLLSTKSDELKCSACELVAEVVQNEPTCQQQALDTGLLQSLVLLVANEEASDTVRAKSLYALSCLIRGNDRALDVFQSRTVNGLSVLLDAMESAGTASADGKLRTKAAFLMSSLCQRPSVRDTLYELGVLDQLIRCLNSGHDGSHEHLMSTLLALVSGHEQLRKDCRHPDRQLRQFLRQRIDQIQTDDKFIEELDYCRQLFDLLFVDKDAPDCYR